MKAAVVLPFAATLAAAGLLRWLSGRRPAAAPPRPWRESALRRRLASGAWPAIAVIVLLVVAPALEVKRDVLTLRDSYARYRLLLCGLPLWLQGGLGLTLLLTASVLTLRLAAALGACPRRGLLLAGAAVVAWAVLYRWVPFHLSAPDYDDFYVVDKLLCTVRPGWGNDKPMFTVYDYLWRVVDLVGPVSDRFGRYAVAAGCTWSTRPTCCSWRSGCCAGGPPRGWGRWSWRRCCWRPRRTRAASCWPPRWTTSWRARSSPCCRSTCSKASWTVRCPPERRSARGPTL